MELKHYSYRFVKITFSQIKSKELMNVKHWARSAVCHVLILKAVCIGVTIAEGWRTHTCLKMALDVSKMTTSLDLCVILLLQINLTPKKFIQTWFKKSNTHYKL